MPLVIRCGYCGYEVSLMSLHIASYVAGKMGYRCPRCLSLLDPGNYRVMVRDRRTGETKIV